MLRSESDPTRHLTDVQRSDLLVQVEWSRKTHDLLEMLWKTPGSGARLGISLLPALRLNNKSLPPPWREVVFSYRELDQEELSEIGRLCTPSLSQYKL